MISKYKKSIISSLIFGALFFGQFNFINSSSFADYNVLNTTTSTEQLSTGVSYNEKLMFTNIGWISVKYMYIDLKDPNTYIDVLYNDNDITVRNKLSKLSTSPSLVGSINGDFFDYDAKSTLGTLVSKGNFISTGIHDGKFSSFNVSNSGIPFLQNWSSAGLKLTSPTATLDMEYKNKPYLNYNRAIIYDRNWKDNSYGNTIGKEVVELVIKDNIITEIRKNMPPVVIDDATTVISAVGTKVAYIIKNFAVGDSVNISYDINFSNIQTSIGGGSIVLENGNVVTNLTLPVAGRHPRTSVGINKDRNKLIYAVIEGRTSSYTGITESELAKIMSSLGAYNALNLDGGGSTEMIKKNLGLDKLTIVNTPTDGAERPIFTGLGVFSSSVKGINEKLNINLTTEAMPNTAIKFDAFSIDENYYKTNLTFADLVLSYKPEEFKIQNNSLIALKEGTFEIEFKYKEQSIKKSVTVKDSIVDLAIANKSIISDVNSKTALNIEAVDENGFKHKVDYSKLSFTFSTNKLGVMDSSYNFVSSANVSNGYMCISYKNIKKYIPVIIGLNQKLITDFEPNEAISKNLKFISYPEVNKGSFQLLKFGLNDSYAALIEYDFTYSLSTRAAYLEFGTDGFKLDDTSKKLGLKVFGNYGNNHWLRAKLTDADGKKHNIDFATNVNWEDWKYVEATIPDTLKRPLKLDRIYLVEEDKTKQDNGTILFDHLVQIGTSDVKVDTPNDVTGIVDIKKSSLDSNLDYKVNIFTTTRNSYGNLGNSINILLTGTDNKTTDIFNVTSRPNKYINTTKNKVKIVNLANNNNSIRKSGYGQWMDLLKLKDNIDSKALVIILSSGKTFNDKLEENLFYDTISAVKKNHNIPVVVVYPSSSSNLEKIKSIDVIGLQTSTLSSKNYLNQYISLGFKGAKTSYQLNK